ncbi:MAG TPA: ribonuclease Y [Candidatus Atribacteria bacterium]|nr:ribonuclease Y [Atribacterota bacterium]HOA98874.1 ribonuclease Y [Candidatus Atribacteria bacterium]HPZ39345.1 ribonuclease Y [Candidatus Atribacteria bacterium]HQD32888.1 ribonuclease Y [Candidatus Atribacteria bacterium]
MELIYILIGIAVGLVAGFSFLNSQLQKERKIAQEEIERVREETLGQVETLRKEALILAKEEVLEERKSLEEEIQRKRKELQNFESRILRREEMLERKLEQVEKTENLLRRRQEELEKEKEVVESIKAREVEELSRIANLSWEEARQELLERVEKTLDYEVGVKIKEAEERAKREAGKMAQEVVAQTIQRYAADFTVENTVSVVNLPSDEMKGRIIGREGRNIRTFEMITGVDLIIDDTPEAVLISSFDPIRREVARLALEKLIVDGRIHPARIEELVDKAKLQVEEKIIQEGEQALFDAGVKNVNSELVKLLGKLYFRTSYGQNVLQHSKEVAYFASLMASELGVDTTLAKRAGLLHDIGKALDHEVEGPHAKIGAELASRYGEKKEVVHAIEAHHGEVEAQTVEAVLVQAADAISASRPGARRESLESYIKRLEKLEKIADGFEGVEKSYAIQAGREIRIMVKPDRIDDARAAKLAYDIARKIEKELEYPGQIKITVIRETRTVEYAK